ncbi:MAG: polysaccharide deacetylase family protein [Oscillospiraceae bacterium]|jgi:peptidoglycan/xylan/chitin deacetylase (PgdA/CDA1 family)|nr:polysaccharide deacetylase family protein [Oscillospiraceae bacterium]
MPAKRWFAMVLVCAALIAVGIGALNFAVDPFGVFGDRVFDWYSYDMTNNPKAAKFEYLERRHAEYDAYVLGPSGSSGLNPAVLERYTGLRWYNLFNYGADMKYTEALAEYLIENYEVKQLILCVPIISAGKYDTVPIGVTEYTPMGFGWRVPFLFADPRYAVDKLVKHGSDGYVQAAHDVFDAESGVYDKSVRDSERIGDLSEYLERNPAFGDTAVKAVELTYTDECVAAVRRIKELCSGQGIGLTVVVPPMYAGASEQYRLEEVAELYGKLAEVTEFWDFSVSAISGDARFFYDKTHFRNSVGDMMLARLFGDEGVYVPEGFGQRVDAAAADSAAARLGTLGGASEAESCELTVLMYHNIIESGAGDSVNRTVADFRADMERLRNEGYSVVGLEDVIGYTERGVDLPENPVLITFDDGYMSNYTLAYPILKEFGYRATIFIIGVSFGKDTYKDSGRAIIPHFGEAEAREMVESGLVTIQSHTYDMHNAEGLDEPCRQGVLRMEGESERDYIAAFREDFRREGELVRQLSDSGVFAVAYPNGYYDTLSRVLLYEEGVKLTFTTESGTNTLLKGVPQSMLGLKRIAVQ